MHCLDALAVYVLHVCELYDYLLLRAWTKYSQKSHDLFCCYVLTFAR